MAGKQKVVLSQSAQSCKTGLYKHYKGKEYDVVGVAVHSETLEEMVVYKALYGSMLTWVRPLSMFFEVVEYNGQKVPRFTYIGHLEKEEVIN